MTPVHQPVGLRLDGRRYCLGSERELRLGVYFWFRLFNVAPETTARFSHLDDQSRNPSPPWETAVAARPGWAVAPAYRDPAQPMTRYFWASRAALEASRSASRERMACRLSWSLRPLARAISTLALPSRKYSDKGTRVRACCWV